MAVALDANRGRLASAGRDGRVIAWDAVAGRELFKLEGRGRDPTCIAISSDGSAVAVGYTRSPVLLWRLAGPNGGRTVSVGPPGAELVALSADGGRLAALDACGVVTTWRTRPPGLLRTVETLGAEELWPTKLVFSKTGRALFQLSNDVSRGDAWNVEATQAVAVSGTWAYELLEESFYGGRVFRFKCQMRDLKLSCRSQWEEELRDSVVVAGGRRGKDRKAISCRYADWDPNANRVFLGLRGGEVVVLRPRRAADTLGDLHLWVFLSLGACLVAWLTRLLWVWARRSPSPLVDSPPPAARLPLSLRVLAFLTILEGVLAALGMVLGVFLGQFVLNVTVINIWAGRGLLRRQNGWRICVLIQIWAGLLAVGLMAGMLGTGGPPANWTLLGQQMGPVAPWAIYPLLGVALVLLLWGMWVLKRRDIAVLFERPTPSQPRPRAEMSDGAT